MTTLMLKNINKRYDDKTIINNLNLSVEVGEFIVIVGSSGSGKSTLLRMIAGLESISSGDVLVNDKKINHLPPKDRDIAMVFQRHALYPHMTVFQNMAYGLRMRGFNKSIIQKRVLQTADTLGLAKLLDRKPNALSGGECQRVAIGRALVRNPSIFLFDEPLSSLDTNLRTQMRFEIKNLQKTLNTTSIYVTHDQVEAMTLADRLVIINEGSVEQIDTPINIYKNPNTRFVAQFIGSPAMNFISGYINSGVNQITLGNDIHFPFSGLESSFYAGQTVDVGIRPENVSLIDSGHGIKLQFSVRYLETLGADTIIYGQIIGLFKQKEKLFAIRVQQIRDFRSDQIIDIFVELNSVHVFVG